MQRRRSLYDGIVKRDCGLNESICTVMRAVKLSVLLACATAACSGGSGEADAGNDSFAVSDSGADAEILFDSGADSGDTQPDATADVTVARPDAGVRCELGPGPYGNRVGDRLPEFRVQGCNGEDVVYPDDFQCPRVLVLVNAAGWCLPCIRETVELMEKLVDPYQARGLEIVQLLYQTETMERPDSTYCNAWVDEFELSRMTVALDPADNTLPLFTPLSLPTSIVVDAAGTIRFYGSATPDELVDIVDTLIREYE